MRLLNSLAWSSKLDAIDLVYEWLQDRGMNVKKNSWDGIRTSDLTFRPDARYRIIADEHPTVIHLMFWVRTNLSSEYDRSEVINMADPKAFEKIAAFIDQ